MVRRSVRALLIRNLACPLVALLAGAASAAAVASAAQERVAKPAPANLTRGCVQQYDAAKDYFPDKVTVEDAVSFAVTYHRSFKVVQVKTGTEGAVERYVLVQCGTPAPPLKGDLAAAEVVTVPITSLYSASPTHLSSLVDLQRLDVLTGVSSRK